MEETMNTDESLDPVREPIKGRTIILGDWFTYRGKRYKVQNMTVGGRIAPDGKEESMLYVMMETAR